MTARLQKPHVRVFNEERDRQALLVVDQRLSMFFGSRRAMKSVAAAEAAAIGAWRVLGAGDRVGAIVFNDREMAEFRARRSRSTVLQILMAIVAYNRSLGVDSGISASPAMLNKALQQAQRRALHDAAVIIISDFDGADDETRRMIGAMARHNDVVALLVHDPLQSDLPASASMTVTDGDLQIHLEVGRESVRQKHLAGVAGAAQGRIRLDAGSRRSRAAAQRRRGDGAATPAPARHPAEPQRARRRPSSDGGEPWLTRKLRQTDPLAGLIDIPLPREVSLWPQTWPLRIAIVLIAAASAAGDLAICRIASAPTGIGARRLPNWKEYADTTGGRAGSDCDAAERAGAADGAGAFPREIVAPLAGAAWLAFLDRSYGGTGVLARRGTPADIGAISTAAPDRRSRSRRWSVSPAAGSGGTMFEFAWPWMLALLPLPILAWWLLPPYRARQASVQVPFFDRLAAATGQTPQRGAVVLQRRGIQMVVATLIWILVVAALARPQWVGDAVTREISARDLILAIDISGSMEQADFRTADGATLTRLDGVKRVVKDFIARRRGDRVALILFGTKAYVQVPFTQDLQTAAQLLDQTQVGMAGQQTAIGDTIGLAIKTLEASTAKQKLLILLTDGNDTASRVPPEHAADIARQNGVAVYTIGVGDPAASGENRVDLGVLQSVAATTGGRFFRAEDGAQLQAIYADIDRLAPAKLDTLSWRPKLPLFQWPLGAAVVLGLALWLGLWLGGERRTEGGASSCMRLPPFPSICCGRYGCSRSFRSLRSLPCCCGGKTRGRNGAG